MPRSTARRARKRGAARRRPALRLRAQTILRRGRDVLRVEGAAVTALLPRIGRTFITAVTLIVRCRGRVVITGMGKAGIIGQKFSATLSSTGTPSFWVHPAEAIHGDLGRLTEDDVVICLSNSGETEELTRLLPIVKKIGAPIVALTGQRVSTLARHSDAVLDVSVRKEAGPLRLAPTASTTAMLAMSDALAMAVADAKGFRERDFATLHPGGQLGKRLLLTVRDVMRTGAANPIVTQQARVKDVLLAITRARAGSATVIDGRKRLIGLFTDGDLRRHLEADPEVIVRPVREVMTRHPKTISPDRLAVEALHLLRAYRVDELPVVDDRGRPIGLLDVQDLLKAGLV